MRDFPALSNGQYLPVDPYREDFERYFWNQNEQGFWKLERRQFFREPRFRPWDVRKFEANGTLPEMITLDHTVMYRIDYGAESVPKGATKYTDTELISSVQGFIAQLYAQGEDFVEFFEREIAPLAPPSKQSMIESSL